MRQPSARSGSTGRLYRYFASILSWGLRNNAGTERLWTVNDQQRGCDHGFEPSATPPVNQGGISIGKSAVGATNSGAQASTRTEKYSGSTRWNHVAKEAQESGMKVRDVRPGAWQPTDKPSTPKAGNVTPSGFSQKVERLSQISIQTPGLGPVWKHTNNPETKMATQGMTQPEKWPMGTAAMGNPGGDTIRHDRLVVGNPPLGPGICTLCGAWWGSLGLEPTLSCGQVTGLCSSCYVCHIVLICRELRTILADHGQFFLNLGDSYIGGKGQSGQGSPEYQALRSDVSFNTPAHQVGGEKLTRPSDRPQPTLKPKDLAMMPARVGIALQQDGWWLRSQIIWAKGVSFNKKGVEELLRPYKEQNVGSMGHLAYDDDFLDLEEVLLNNTYVGNSMPESVHGWSFQVEVDKDGIPNPCLECSDGSCGSCYNGLVVEKRLGSGRGTRSYEIILQLTKTDADYSDPAAVRESSQPSSLTRYEYSHHRNETGKFPNAPQGNTSSKVDRMGDSISDPGGRNLRNVWEIPDPIWTFPTRGFGWQLCPNCDTVYDPREYKALPKVRVRIDWKTKAQVDGGPVGDFVNHQDGGDTGLDEPDKKGWLEPRVCKTCGSPDLVDKDGQEISYEILSKYQMSHYSSFPEALPELAIKFGCPERVCTECERPWARVTMAKKVPHPGRWSKTANAKQNVDKGKGYAETGGLGVDNVLETLGWKPTCQHNSYRPGIVLDPFSGTCTTLIVAKRLGRDAYGFELSTDYCKLGSERLHRAAATG